MTDPRWVLAIDFGTTNTVAAVQRPGERPRVLAFGGRSSVPSSVFLTDDGIWEVGRAAENRARTDLSRFEATPKRRVGDPALFLGGQDIAVPDAIAAVVDHVVREAVRQHGGQRPEMVVMTHPQTWSATRVAMLGDVARRVLSTQVGGVKLTLVPEPVAAAVHAATQVGLPDRSRVAVFDLGGGTLDIAVLDRDRGSPEGPEAFSVAATAGLDPLGGEDFDTRLAVWVLEQVGDPAVRSRLTAPAGDADRAAALELRRSAREAKEALSEGARAFVTVPRLAPQLPEGRSVQVSREQFEELIAEDLRQATALLSRTLDRAPDGPALAGVFLVGGSSRIPMLGRSIAEAIGHNPADYGDPATVVAEGAAHIATVQLVAASEPIPAAATSETWAAMGPGDDTATTQLGLNGSGRWGRRAAIAGAAVATAVAIATVIIVIVATGSGPPAPPGSTTVAAPTPTTAEPQIRTLGSVFPDAVDASRSCNFYSPKQNEFLAGQNRPIEVLKCTSWDQPGVDVYFARWSPSADLNAWIEELRGKYQAASLNTTWSANDPQTGQVERGRFFAAQFSATVQYYGAFYKGPFSYLVMAPTIDAADAVFAQIRSVAPSN